MSKARQHWIVITIAVAQLSLAITLILLTPDLWPRDDAVAYFTQAVRIMLGGMPDDPTRPLLYPFLIGSVMKLTGLDSMWPRLIQAFFYCLTTLLLYRLAFLACGKKCAVIAAGLFALFPDGLFFSTRFYKETLTAFFLVLSLNLIGAMIDNPKRPLTAAFAGLSCGFAVMMRQELGLLYAILAVWNMLAYVKNRAALWKKASVWLICGLTALASTVPAVIAARAEYGEWIFLTTYRGTTYYWAFCGELRPEGEDLEGKSFTEIDNKRAAWAMLRANDVIYFSDPSVPFGKRDAILMDRAIKCMMDNPTQSIEMVAKRSLETVFLADNGAYAWVMEGDFGKGWPAWTVRTLQLLDLIVDLFFILFLLPGLLALKVSEEGRRLAAVFLFYLVFYSTVLYVARYRISFWPICMIISAAGSIKVFCWFKQARLRTRAAYLIYAGLCMTLFIRVPENRIAEVLSPQSWSKVEIGDGMTPGHKVGYMMILAKEYADRGSWERINRELGPYIERGLVWVNQDLLLYAGDLLGAEIRPSTAKFFYQMAAKTPGDEHAWRARIESLEKNFLRAELTDMARAGEDQATGIAVYAGELPQPVLSRENAPPPLEMAVTFQNRKLSFNANLKKGLEADVYQYYFLGNRIWITLPASGPRPGGESPLSVNYYFVPKRQENPGQNEANP